MIDNFNFRSYKDLVRKNPVRDTKRGVSSLITQWWDIMGYAEPFKTRWQTHPAKMLANTKKWAKFELER